MLEPESLLHLQKLVDEPKLQSNSTFNITYTFIVTNRTNESINKFLPPAEPVGGGHKTRRNLIKRKGKSKRVRFAI